ncbi:MAG: GNAT family N-acetyltransferase [Lachnospiraceae bacterium]|nr:GNAT family N-acetyltransferase [Lachnospiraceae bacterium]
MSRIGSYGFGVTIMEDDEPVPAGALIFSIDMTNTDEDIASLIELNWIYVDEKYRNMGVGTRLINVFSNIISNAEMNCVVCDVPLDSEYDYLVEYLENWGFFFQLIEKNEYYITWDDISDYPLFKEPEKPTHVISMNSLSDDEYRRTLKFLGASKWLELSRDEPDPDLSCVCMHNDKPMGIFLIRRNPETFIEPLLIKGTKNSKVSSPEIRELISYAIKKLPVSFKKVSLIHVMIRSQFGAELWDYLFPDIYPTLTRRGVHLI